MPPPLGGSNSVLVQQGTGTSSPQSQWATIGAGLSLSGGTLSATGGGASGTVTSVSAGTGITCTPNPITVTGTVAMTTPVSVANGGTGNSTLTAHAVILGEGTSAVAFATIGTSGRPLLDQGSGTDPAFLSTGVKIDSHFGAITTDADGATITFNMATSDQHEVTLGGNRTLAVSNMTNGQRLDVRIQQAASGGPYAITWFSGITWIGSPFTAPVMPTTASAWLTAVILQRSSGSYFGWWLGNSAT